MMIQGGGIGKGDSHLMLVFVAGEKLQKRRVSRELNCVSHH